MLITIINKLRVGTFLLTALMSVSATAHSRSGPANEMRGGILTGAGALALGPVNRSAEVRGPNLSNTPGESQDPDLATAGDNVYVVWSDLSTGNGDIFIAISSDHGASFSTGINLSKSLTVSRHPSVAAENKNVFVVWEEAGPFSTLFFTLSTDFGESFAAPAQLDSLFGDAVEPKVIAMWGHGYVAWRAVQRDLLTLTPIIGSVRFRVIGEPFVTTIVSVPWQVQDISLAGGGASLYVSWSGNFRNSDLDPYFSTSTDGGHTFRVFQYPADQASPRGDFGDQINGGVAAQGNTVVWYYESNRVPLRTVNLTASNRAGAGILDDTGHLYALNRPTIYSDPSGEAFRTPMTPSFVVDGTRFIGAWVVARPLLAGGFVQELHSWRSDRTEFVITSSGNPRNPKIALLGATSLVVYEGDASPGGAADVFACLAGESTSHAYNLSMTPERSRQPKVAASGPNYVVVWTEETKKNTEIFFRTISARDGVIHATKE